MSKPKQPRKEVTSLRLEPKIKYLAEIAARQQRRSLTNYIEWALEESLKTVNIGDIAFERSVYELSDHLWDLSEAKRFIRLATYRNDLLTYEEQKLWGVITKHPYLYLKKCPGAWTDDNIKFDDLDNDWDLLIQASYDDKEALKKLDEAHTQKMPTPINLSEDLSNEIKRFIENAPPKDQKAREQYDKQFHELLITLEDIIRSKGE